MKLEDLEAKLGIANMGEEEKLALVKDIQANIPALKAEQRVLEAKTQANLVVEAIKKIKEGLEARFDELNGIVDVKVRDITSGKDGIDGKDGRDGVNGKDGKDGLSITGPKGADGQDGEDGVGVQDAHIDFDGSLIITLTNGKELNVGEVVPFDVAEKIKVIGNGGGTSQSVLDSLASLQTQINTLTGIDGVLGTIAQQDANAVAITGGTIDNTVIGSTTPAAGTFTTLTANSTSQFGKGSANYVEAVGASTGNRPSISAIGSDTNVDLRLVSQGTGALQVENTSGGTTFQVLTQASNVNYARFTSTSAGISPLFQVLGSDTNVDFRFRTQGTGAYQFDTGSNANTQLRVANTTSAVNYVQVTGAATGGSPAITAQGSDTDTRLTLRSKGNASIAFENSSGNRLFDVPNVFPAVNYLQPNASIATQALILKSVGSDTNISQVFQSKGTGAIDLAAGSSGVNISNGGTVTALTLTNLGTSSYTSLPSVAITAPTTAGGVQATASVSAMSMNGVATPVSGGTGYSVNDVLSVAGGTFSSVLQLRVTTVSGGVVTAVTYASGFGYTVLPTNPVSVTGGTGSGATFTIPWGVQSLSIGTAGSGYVEQPTVTFSGGGGGSGAAAYARIGSDVTIKSLGTNINLQTANANTALQLSDTGGSGVGYWRFMAGYSGNATMLSSSVNATISNSGVGNISFFTNSIASEQLRVAHTASAVNYVQVTGAATGGSPTISAQGSDSNPNITLQSKGTGNVVLMDGGGNTGVRLLRAVASGDTFVDVQRNVGFVDFIASSSVTDGDIRFTPKGAGTVRTSGTGVRLVGSTSGYVGLKGAAVAGSTTYTLPAADGTSGQVLATNGSATLSWATASGGGALAKQTDVFTTGSSATYTAPANTQWVKITVVGKGGNGGGTTSQRGSGGGAGGIAIKWLAITAGQTLTYTVNVSNLPNFVTSGTYTLAADIVGYAGIAGTSVAYAASFTAGGAGGNCSGGDINIRGGNGGSAFGTSTAVGTQQSGFGGSNMFGAGGYAVGIAITAGVDGTGYGGGGGGSIGSTTVGLGTNGVIIFEAY